MLIFLLKHIEAYAPSSFQCFIANARKEVNLLFIASSFSSFFSKFKWKMFSFYSFAFFWHHNYVSVQFFSRRFYSSQHVCMCLLLLPRLFCYLFHSLCFSRRFLLYFSSRKIHFRNQELFTVFYIAAVWKITVLSTFIYFFMFCLKLICRRFFFIWSSKRVFFKSFFFTFSNCRQIFRFSKFLNFQVTHFLLCRLICETQKFHVLYSTETRTTELFKIDHEMCLLSTAQIYHLNLKIMRTFYTSCIFYPFCFGYRKHTVKDGFAMSVFIILHNKQNQYIEWLNVLLTWTWV